MKAVPAEPGPSHRPWMRDVVHCAHTLKPVPQVNE